MGALRARARAYGVFCYLPDAREARPDLTRAIDDLYDWFNLYLNIPSKLNLERCWFRAEATRYVSQGRRLAELVRAADIPIVERRIRRIPGVVRFQDRDQVAVLTYRDTPRVSELRTVARSR